MELTYSLAIFLLISYHAYGLHVPEDSPNDGVTLVRQKRNNFIDRILKSIPFLHYSSPSNVITEEQLDPLMDDDDANDDEVETTVPSILFSSLISTPVGVSTFPPSTLLADSKSSNPATVLSAVIPPTPTISSAYQSNAVSMSKDKSTQTISTSTNATLITATPTISIGSTLKLQSMQISSSISKGNYSSIESVPLMTSISATSTISSFNSSSYTYPSSASILTTMSASVDIKPTTVHTMQKTISPKELSDAPINMMIISGENPLKVQDYGARVADERGYGDEIGKYRAEGEDMEIKNIQFMYSGVLIPVMSGILGALLITFVILIYKCIRRKKLRRVRYYGAKPGSGLYRLDQMSLLSDMSSDEE